MLRIAYFVNMFTISVVKSLLLKQKAYLDVRQAELLF